MGLSIQDLLHYNLPPGMGRWKCQLLVEEERFDVNFIESPWLSPLSHAVLGGHSQSVGRYLLEKGADMNLLLSEATEIWPFNTTNASIVG